MTISCLTSVTIEFNIEMMHFRHILHFTVNIVFHCFTAPQMNKALFNHPYAPIFGQCDFITETRFEPNMYIKEFCFSVVTNGWGGARVRTGQKWIQRTRAADARKAVVEGHVQYNKTDPNRSK